MQNLSVRTALAQLLQQLDTQPDTVYSLSVVAVLDGGDIIQATLPPATLLEQAAMRGLLFSQATALEVVPCNS